MSYNNHDFEEVVQRGRGWDFTDAYPVLMRKVYLWMTLALVITGATAYGVATTPSLLMAIATNKILFFGLIIAEFALVIGLSAALPKLSLATATLMFVVYSVINGATLSFIFLVYTEASITSVFFITAATFAVMSVVGLTTKADLTSLGKMLFMFSRKVDPDFCLIFVNSRKPAAFALFLIFLLYIFKIRRFK